MTSDTVAQMKAAMAEEVKKLLAEQEKERESLLAKLAREHGVAMERMKKEWVRKLRLKQDEEMMAFKDEIGVPRAAYAAALERTSSSSSAQSSASTATASTGRVVYVNGCEDCSRARLMFCGCKTLKCRDCKADFLFTAGEVSFYKERGLTIPIRCCGCRKKKKTERGKRE